MKRSLTKVFSALCALALLLAPAAAIAEGEQRDPIELNIGSDRNAWFVVPGDGFDANDMYLNGTPYVPELNQRNDMVVRTGDLLAAKAIWELPNVEPEVFQISGGQISLHISDAMPDEVEAAPPATDNNGEETETATVFAGNGLRTWLRSGPDGKRLRLLSDGTTVTVLSRDDGWCKVTIGNDTGYIMTKSLQFADNSDNLPNVQQVLENADPFLLEGVTFELSDGQGNKQSIIPSNVWQSPITVQHNPNDMVLPEAAGSKPIPQ